MRMTKKFVACAAAAATMAVSALVPMASAQADVSASVGVANMYYWRGLDLGNGNAAVSGDLTVSAGGAYSGVWASSGDAAAGTEYDLYAGYGQSFGDFSIDISAWTYTYPSASEAVIIGDDNAGHALRLDSVSSSPGDLSEIVLAVGWGPVSASYYDNVAGDSGYWYATLGAAFDAFSVTYGLHEDDYAHLDLSYAYNDNLSFTLGVPVDDVDGAYDDDPMVVVSYSLPIE